ncbi:hypothetical protein F5I97DRAFT_1816285 [Phlebopus sp. FC_14]|nr:hypothetical protein F5I97DRAFT_1816285 [Phlebopus sp. FC_14]
MAEQSDAQQSQSRGHGRGRGKSRGGLGKYLRARGRGRGYGRPAEFTKRLVLEDEETANLDPEEAKELERKYGKRQLASNADRYVEEEPGLDSDGEEIREPEVDISAFLERQRLSDTDPAQTLPLEDEDEDDVDHSLDLITSRRQAPSQSKKGRVQTIEWDEELEAMSREKAVAEAHRDLKERFRAKTDKLLRTGPMAMKERKRENNFVEAPKLPTEQVPKAPKEEMQDFLDELIG